MASTDSSLVVTTSLNAVNACFGGVQEEQVTRQYIAATQRFLASLEGKPWARIVDLRKWTLTLPRQTEDMFISLQHDIEHGLEIEVILLPDESVGRWQIDKVLNKLEDRSRFHFANTMEEAVEMIAKAGFDTDFQAFNP